MDSSRALRAGAGEHETASYSTDRWYAMIANRGRVTLRNVGMPFEVTPILFRLTRYADPAAIAAQTAATGANTRAVHGQK